jgi:hypothetical protein
MNKKATVMLTTAQQRCFARSLATGPFLLFATIGVITTPSCAFSQTFAQSAGYLLSGGLVDLGDIKSIDDDTVAVPGHMVTPTFFVPPMIFKITNKQQCEVSFQPQNPNTSPVKAISTFYLNNVIVSETTDKQVPGGLRAFSYFTLSGEEPIQCVGGQSCSRTQSIVVKTETVPRLYNAIKYIYSTFCTSARRKSAF